MGGGDLHALRHALPSHDRQHQTLAAVAGVDLVPRPQSHAAPVLHEAVRLRRGDGGAGTETLGLIAQKSLVIGAVVLHPAQLRFLQHIVAAAAVPQELLTQRLHFLAHARSSFNIRCSAA